MTEQNKTMTNIASSTKNDSLPDRWLVYRLGHLGDVALATGVLAYLADTRGWRFAVATKKHFAPLFDNIPHVERVFALGEADLDFRSFIAHSRRMADALPGWGLLDLHASIRSRILGLNWPATVARYPKMGFARRVFLKSGGRFCKERLNALSVPQRYALAVEAVAPPKSRLAPRIILSHAELAEANAMLFRLFCRTGTDPGLIRPSEPIRPIALHPFATHALKAWPKSHWLRLAALLDSAGLPWICIGTGAPFFTKRKEDLVGSTSLRQSCALLARCRTLVTGDSGPMHLASAVGTPVTALFGPTTKEWGFYPDGPLDVVLERPFACRPCSLHGMAPCPKDGECLALITPEEVLSAIASPARGL